MSTISLTTALEGWGFEIEENSSVGNAQAILFSEEGIIGVSDPRGDGLAKGY